MRQARPGAGCDTDQGLTNIMESDTDTDTGSQEHSEERREVRRERYIENIQNRNIHVVTIYVIGEET